LREDERPGAELHAGLHGTTALSRAFVTLPSHRLAETRKAC
jgi:hypothetical protein